MFKKKMKSGGASRRRVLVDTSTLIDGRILAVAKSGFIGDELVIPRSVLGELQMLADSNNSEKRTRARFGLDVIRELQEIKGMIVTILADEREAAEGVDARLLDLARQERMLIMTNDFNLNKVATVEGVRVLNINDLSQGLRSTYLPGDKLVLELVQKGSEGGQTVGYLTDGTMVVVENSAGSLGKKVEVEFIRYLQTSAGKMMFAKLAGGTGSAGARAEVKKVDVVRADGAGRGGEVKQVQGVRRSEAVRDVRRADRNSKKEARKNARGIRKDREMGRRAKTLGVKGKVNSSVKTGRAALVSGKRRPTSASKEDELMKLVNQ